MLLEQAQADIEALRRSTEYLPPPVQNELARQIGFVMNNPGPLGRYGIGRALEETPFRGPWAHESPRPANLLEGRNRILAGLQPAFIQAASHGNPSREVFNERLQSYSLGAMEAFSSYLPPTRSVLAGGSRPLDFAAYALSQGYAAAKATGRTMTADNRIGDGFDPAFGHLPVKSPWWQQVSIPEAGIKYQWQGSEHTLRPQFFNEVIVPWARRSQGENILRQMVAEGTISEGQAQNLRFEHLDKIVPVLNNTAYVARGDKTIEYDTAYLTKLTSTIRRVALPSGGMQGQDLDAYRREINQSVFNSIGEIQGAGDIDPETLERYRNGFGEPGPSRAALAEDAYIQRMRSEAERLSVRPSMRANMQYAESLATKGRGSRLIDTPGYLEENRAAIAAGRDLEGAVGRLVGALRFPGDEAVSDTGKSADTRRALMPWDVKRRPSMTLQEAKDWIDSLDKYRDAPAGPSTPPPTQVGSGGGAGRGGKPPVAVASPEDDESQFANQAWNFQQQPERFFDLARQRGLTPRETYDLLGRDLVRAGRAGAGTTEQGRRYQVAKQEMMGHIKRYAGYNWGRNTFDADATPLYAAYGAEVANRDRGPEPARGIAFETGTGWSEHFLARPGPMGFVEGRQHGLLGRFEEGQWVGENGPTLTREQTQFAVGEARALFDSAANRNFGNDPSRAKEAAAELAISMQDKLSGWFKNQQAAIAKLSKDLTPEETFKLNEDLVKMKTAINMVASEHIDRIAKEVGAKGYKELAYSNITLRGLDDIKALAEIDPDYARAVQNAGGASAFMQRGGLVTGPPGSTPVRVYPTGGGGSRGGIFGGGRGGGPQSLWGGGIGRALYGAYIAKRMWGMLAQPHFQAAEQYAATMAELEPLAYRGQSDYSLGVGAYPSQQSIANLMRGQGAWETLGTLRQLGNVLSSDPVANRAFSGLGVAAGLAAGGHIAAGAMTMMGMGQTVAAGVLGPVGVAAGVASAGMWLGAEASNAINSILGRQTSYGAWDWTRVLAQTGYAKMGARWFGALMKTGGDQSAYDRYVAEKYPMAWSFLAGDSDAPEAVAMQQLATDLSFDTPLTVDQTAPVIGAYQAIVGKVVQPGSAEAQDLTSIIKAAISRGEDPAQAISSLAQTAVAQGYTPGTQSFAREVQRLGQMGGPERFQYGKEVSERAGMAGMFRRFWSQGQMSDRRLQERVTSRYATPQEAEQGYAAMQAAKSWGMGTTQAWGFAGRFTGMSSQEQQRQLGVLGVAAPYLSQDELGQWQGALSGMTPDEQNLVGSMLAGDVKAWSYAANTGFLGAAGSAFQFYDLAGAPSYEENWGGFMGMLGGQAQLGLPAAAGFMGFTGNLAADTQMFFGQRGIKLDAGALSAYTQGYGGLPGGTAARTQLHSDRMFGFQMAGIGVGLAQIAARRENMGIMWGLQDTMRGLQHEATMAQFATTQERLEVGRGYALQEEAIGGERMAASQGYQRWSMAFERAGRLQSREWTREDWQFQDTMTSLEFGWGMEDLNESIRMSSGRDRRQLVKERERAALRQNLKGQQTERTRDRQEEVWAREDERFEKQRSHAEELMDLDQRQFDLAVERSQKYYDMDVKNLQRRIEEYEKQKAVQDQIIEVQRAFQEKSLQFSEQSLRISAGAALEQKRFNDELNTTKTSFDRVVGQFASMGHYNIDHNVSLLKSLILDLSNINFPRVPAWLLRW